MGKIVNRTIHQRPKLQRLRSKPDEVLEAIILDNEAADFVADTQEPIRRSSRFARPFKQVLFAMRAKSPRVFAYAPRLRHPSSQEARDILQLQNCLLDNSTTYALALEVIRPDAPELYRTMLQMHQWFKMKDLILEKDISREERRDLANRFDDAISNPDYEEVAKLRARLLELGFNKHDEEHTSLVRNLPVLIRAAQNRPEKVREAFLKYSNIMVGGVTREDFSIDSFGGVDKDCYFHAGTVAEATIVAYEVHRYITAEQRAGLRKPARWAGKGAQLGNNVRDLWKDIDMGIAHWPSSIIEKLKEAFPEEPSQSDEDKARVVYEKVFVPRILNYASKHIINGAGFSESLPPESEDFLRTIPDFGLAAYALHVQGIQEAGIDFMLTRGEYKKPTPADYFDAMEVVTGLAGGESIRPYLEHLLIDRKPTEEFRAA